MISGGGRECVKKAAELIFAAVIFGGLAATAMASETITYTYDVRGRLVRVAHSGNINNNVVANYTHDNADNRILVNVTGAP